jgi:hypothetical protein
MHGPFFLLYSLDNFNHIEEAARRRITVTSSSKEISTDQLDRYVFKDDMIGTYILLLPGYLLHDLTLCHTTTRDTKNIPFLF